MLVARAKTLLKRADGVVGVAEENAMSLAGIEVNRLSRTVLVDGEEIILTHKEFELLVYLMENKGIVLSRQHLLDQLWGYDYYGDDRTVDTHIKKLRNKLEIKRSISVLLFVLVINLKNNLERIVCFSLGK